MARTKRKKPEIFEDMCRGKVPLSVIRSVANMDANSFDTLRVISLFYKCFEILVSYRLRNSLGITRKTILLTLPTTTAGKYSKKLWVSTCFVVLAYIWERQALQAIHDLEIYEDVWPAIVCYRKTCCQRRNAGKVKYRPGLERSSEASNSVKSEDIVSDVLRCNAFKYWYYQPIMPNLPAARSPVRRSTSARTDGLSLCHPNVSHNASSTRTMKHVRKYIRDIQSAVQLLVDELDDIEDQEHSNDEDTSIR